MPYTNAISDALPETWCLAQVHLSSSYTAWGTSSLKNDARELAKCVTFFRTIKDGKIVLMGHSTGCQDVMEYLTGTGHENRPTVEGGILQAPASDREGIVMELGNEKYLHSVVVATKMVEDGHGERIIPSSDINNVFPCPVSARRWLSLASPYHDGDDDYFSSDLKDEQLMKSFGTLPKESPVCVLMSEKDEYVPKSVHKEGLIARWAEIAGKGQGKIDDANSAVIQGATHNLEVDPVEVVGELVKKVLGVSFEH